jgi:hypothetical protein
MRRDRAVIDDAAATRILQLHDLDGFARAKEWSGRIDINNALPFLERHVFKGHALRKGAGIVEQEIETAELLTGNLEC